MIRLRRRYPPPAGVVQRVFASRAALVLAGAIALVMTGMAALRALQLESWDLRTYYWAGRAWLAGEDPYSVEVLSRLGGVHLVFPFVYPPPATWLFAQLARVELPTAARLYLGLKVVALAGLLALWLRFFVRDTPGRIVLLVLFARGFRRAVRSDVIAGNISAFEQLAVWGGIVLLLHRKALWFGVLLAFAAVFKLVPLALLPLAAMVRRTPRALLAAGAGASLLAVVNGLAALLDPAAVSSFLRAATGLDERGPSNPSSLAFARDTVESLAGVLGFAPPPALSLALFGAVIVAVGAATAHAAVRGARRDEPLAMIALGVLAYALVMPRFKDYSYLALLVPAALVLRELLRRAPVWVVALLVLCCTEFHPYQPLASATVLFVLAYRQAMRGAQQEARPALDARLRVAA